MVLQKKTNKTKKNTSIFINHFFQLDYFIGILLIINSLIFSSSIFDQTHIIRYISLTISLLSIFLYLFIFKKKIIFPNQFIILFYIAFLIFYSFSSCFSINKAESFFEIGKLFLSFLVFLLVYNKAVYDYNSLIKIFIISALIVMSMLIMVVIYQLSNIHDLSYNELYKVVGLNGHKNLLSINLFLLSGFVLMGTIFYKRKLLFVLLPLISIFIIIILKSRASLIGCIFAFIILISCYLFRKFNYNKIKFNLNLKIGVASFLSILLLVFFVFILKYYIKNNSIHTDIIDKSILNTYTLSERLTVWDKTYKLIEKQPLTGVGIGNWKVAFPSVSLNGLWRADYLTTSFTRPHCDFLSYYSEGGILTLATYLIFISFLITFVFFSIVQEKDKQIFKIKSILLSLLVGFHCIAFFDFPKERVEIIIWISSIMGFLFVFINNSNHKNNSIQLKNNLLIISMLLIVLGIGYLRYKGEKMTGKIQQCMQMQQWNDMEINCNKAISVFYNIDPMAVPLEWFKAFAQIQQNKNPLSSLLKAYSIAPYNKQVLNDLGFEYFRCGKVQQAIPLFNEAIRISPFFEYPYYNLVQIYLNNKQYDKALKTLNSMRTDSPKRAQLTTYVQLLMKQ